MIDKIFDEIKECIAKEFTIEYGPEYFNMLSYVDDDTDKKILSTTKRARNFEELIEVLDIVLSEHPEKEGEFFEPLCEVLRTLDRMQRNENKRRMIMNKVIIISDEKIKELQKEIEECNVQKETLYEENDEFVDDLENEEVGDHESLYERTDRLYSESALPLIDKQTKIIKEISKILTLSNKDSAPKQNKCSCCSGDCNYFCKDEFKRG